MRAYEKPVWCSGRRDNSFRACSCLRFYATVNQPGTDEGDGKQVWQIRSDKHTLKEDILYESLRSLSSAAAAQTLFFTLFMPDLLCNRQSARDSQGVMGSRCGSCSHRP